ncbi:phosphate transporter [Desulfofarcimen acetoxidans DSM 771]|jgi:PiT family inorganic phosphate transporter|uniref:Phosphate transporter n=1 Tax=Desulfofarcimen acetoxidans (strain ATCC 49208 / DSM 771 / KCTC 5769 / VKM B-1644 / 5575) TaxID=485916 RepID=C8W0E1_DESAS|nr:inorganic phosphate transporter [Desulfofarcimen acetoxidans]ACV63196.1 phosphate transporter [Desulfofarcimen acetoxidans DSM 771]
MDSTLVLIAAVVLLALSFDFINGFHDTANAIATSISTKALTPRAAIVLASTMNLVGALTFTGVAKTIGGKIADPMKLEHGLPIVIAALVAAIIWNLITWYYGIPSSSSHALIGALTGSVIASAGLSAVNFAGFLTILQALILSPVLAFCIGYIIMSILRFVFRSANPRSTNRMFRFLQILTAAFQAFSHGTNDAQKSMGIITFALIAGGLQNTHDIPFWVKLTCAIAMALGTSVGGWKIIKTVGTQIIKLKPISGFASDVTSASVIIGATIIGQPVSTTHVISSAIMGVGSAKRLSCVKWCTAQRMITAWLITLPITATLAGLVYLIASILF